MTNVCVEIDGIAAGGDGVGRTDKLVVFVPRTAPGDSALVRLQAGKRFARGELESLVVASPVRVEPRCSHYVGDRCGGCQIQHLAYPAQLAAKSSIVRETIRRIGKRDSGSIAVAPAAEQWEYRRKLTLHLRRVGTSWIAGLHPYDNPVHVFDLRECPITESSVLRVWDELRPQFEYLPREPALRMSVRVSQQGSAVVLEGGRSWPSAQRFFDACPSIGELWWRPERGQARQIAARENQDGTGASFTQINARVADELRGHVIDRVRHHNPKTIVDAYAGSGGTAEPLAEIARLTAIELDANAVRDLRTRLKPPASAIAGRVEDHLPRALPADVVVVNPPRTGVDERVTAILQATPKPPRAIVYVSCDPATLARDIARMPRYTIGSVRAYDMFPQTAHVETVCELVLEST